MPMTIRCDLMETAPGQNPPEIRLYMDVYSRGNRRFLAFFDEKGRRHILRKPEDDFTQTEAAKFITEISAQTAVENLLAAGIPAFRPDTSALTRLCKPPKSRSLSIPKEDYNLQYALIDPILDMIKQFEVLVDLLWIPGCYPKVCANNLDKDQQGEEPENQWDFLIRLGIGFLDFAHNDKSEKAHDAGKNGQASHDNPGQSNYGDACGAFFYKHGESPFRAS